MAVLTNEDRAALHAAYQEYISNLREEVPLTKAQLRAAIDAIDSWIDSNAASYNSAIPQPARGALTARQKADLLLWVVRQRFNVT